MPYRDPAKQKIADAARSKQWREKNKAKIKAQRQTPEYREIYKHYYRKHMYGLTKDEFKALVKAHDGKCKLCDAPTEKLHVDHDHKTGRVRGLLCFSCNTALGHFRDDPVLLRKAIEYLK